METGTAASEEAPARRSPPRPRSGGAPLTITFAVLVALAALPIVWSTAAALADDWTPVGDSATLALRAGDVLRGDPPLVGMPSTSNTIAERDVAHPGPLEVWVAAVPVALFGPTGMVLTIAAANVAAVVGAIWVAWRRGGPGLAGATTATVLVLSWALGTTVLRDPLNSHLQLLPWFALVLLCWDIRLGRWASIPLAVLAGSWVTQAHVVYVPMVLVVGTATAGSCWWDLRHASARQRTRARIGRRQGLLAGLAVGLVLSLPMLIDQVTGSGNLGTMLGFSGQESQGLRRALAALVVHLGLPPAFAVAGNDPLVLLRRPEAADLVGFAVAVLAIAWALHDTGRRRDRRAATLVHASLWAIAAVMVAVARTPDAGAVLAADAMLVWKPTTALVALAAGWAAWRALTAAEMVPRLHLRQRRALQVVGVVAAVGISAATVAAPARFGGFGEDFGPAAAELRDLALPAAEGQDLVQVNASGWAARLYLRHTLVEAFERAGVETVVPDDPRVFRRPADERRSPTATVWVVSGEATDATDPPAPGARLVGEAELVGGGAASGEVARRRELRRRLDQAGTVVLQPGRISLADLRQEYFRWDEPDAPADRTLPSEWVSVDAFVDLHRNAMVASPRIDDRLVDQVHDDALGRYFAADDVVASIWVRDERP